MPPRRASANILRKLRGQNLRLKIMGKIVKLPGIVDTSSWVCFQWQSRCWLDFRSFIYHIFQEKLFWSAIIFHHHHLPSIWQKHLLAKDLRNLQMGETLNVHVDRFALLALVNLVAHIDNTFDCRKLVELNGQCKKKLEKVGLGQLGFWKKVEKSL